MSVTYAGIEAIADTIASLIWHRNDIVEATITADLGLVNNTPQVSVSVGGASRVAIYACPIPIQLLGCFVCPTHAGPGADLLVIATNYQVGTPGAGGAGYGGGGFGTGGYGA